MIKTFLKAQEAFTTLCPLLEQNVAQTKTERDIRQLADTAYAMREAYALLDRLRKDVKAIQDLAEKMACLLYTADATHSANDSIRTGYCTATPDVGLMASLPKKNKDPEGFAAMMQYMGIPDVLWNTPSEDDEAVRPHWPGMVSYLTKLMGEGRPLPPGLNPERTYPVYKLKIRKVKDIVSYVHPKEEEESPF